MTATYANGVPTPSEPLDIGKGKKVTLSKEVTLSIEDLASPKRGLADIVKAAQELHRAIPPGAWDVPLEDGARNYKHYPYGSPKEED